MSTIPGFSAPYSIHLGCNTTKIYGWVNVDARQTSATDLVHDCGNLAPFEDRSASMIYSNAFFEHLTMAGREELLKETIRVLTDDGLLYFSGIPDFEVIARSYLEKKQGHVSPRFDLYEVYRYTHGDPEHQPTWWLEQLHKTLFDVETVKALLNRAGFRGSSVYRYAYGQEMNPVNLGFFAWKDGRVFTANEAREHISTFAPLSGVRPDSLELDL